MSVPKFLQPHLASYNFSKLDVGGDRELIITEVLNKGDFKALKWLCNNYSRRELEAVVKYPTRGMWMKSILVYWMKIFGIKLPEKVFRQAIFDLNPYNEEVTPRGFK